ncbi:NUDIX hydrolase [Streptomyces sp. NBC_01808]|uniref:NUDIX hydrolase n=1 Tax=Streptomyces sp. NBC_01808 TaxID=2975947 RepID=UPI002DD7CE98|nr:NUDIX hydrolase [Streptomyces sp. NBC_01808]WSA39695.1 NUDIX hydrolase [Streptomyces sp. NBC_01808]
MTVEHDPLEHYLKLRRDHPGLFLNEPGGIEILDGVTAVDGVPVGVVYRDPYVTVVRDPVRFPDGRRGTYIRLLDAAGAPGVVALPLLGGGAEVVLLEHYRHATRAWHVEVPRGFGTPGLSAPENAAKEVAEEIGATARGIVPLGRLHPDTGLVGGHTELYAVHIDGYGEPGRPEGIRRVFSVLPAEAEDLVRTGRITDAFTIAVLARARLAGLLADTA